MCDQPALEELLSQACPGGPASLRPSQGGGDALALALHCLMVRDGFVALDRSSRPLLGYQLPQDWNAVDHLWAWEYSRPGAARLFRLQCGMQPATRRMFVHASEIAPGGEPLKDNIQVMGIQVDNYVRLPKQEPGSSSSGGSWQGVIMSERTLCDMWEEYVAAPLWRRAEKAAPGSSISGGGGSGWAGVLREPRVLLPAAAVLTAVVAAVLLHRRRASSS